MFHLPGICGLLFSDQREAAFAGLRMYESVGFCISTAYSQFLCMTVKMYITGGLLILAVCGYFLMEHFHKKDKCAMTKAPKYV